jgi:hypothetical protein
VIKHCGRPLERMPSQDRASDGSCEDHTLHETELNSCFTELIHSETSARMQGRCASGSASLRTGAEVARNRYEDKSRVISAERGT